MIERALRKQATAAGFSMVQDTVDFPERTFPFGFVGAEEDERGRADEGGEVGEGTVVANKSLTGGKEGDEFVAFEMMDDGGAAKLLGEGFGGLRAAGSGEDHELALLGDRPRKLGEVGQGPFRSRSKVGAWNERDAEGPTGSRALGRLEV